MASGTIQKTRFGSRSNITSSLNADGKTWTSTGSYLVVAIATAGSGADGRFVVRDTSDSNMTVLSLQVPAGKGVSGAFPTINGHVYDCYHADNLSAITINAYPLI